MIASTSAAATRVAVRGRGVCSQVQLAARRQSTLQTGALLSRDEGVLRSTRRTLDASRPLRVMARLASPLPSRSFTSTSRIGVPSDDPGGKPIPTDGSYQTVYDDFKNITGSDEGQLSIHTMGESSFTMTDGLVAHSPIMMINKQVLLWDAPPLGGKDAQGNDIVVMPTGRGWEAWTDDVWRIFEVIQPRPEILIFGTGKIVCPVPPQVKRYLNRLGIQVEAHSSRNACSTYNMLADEERLVAAAILPNVRQPTERMMADEKPVEPSQG